MNMPSHSQRLNLFTHNIAMAFAIAIAFAVVVVPFFMVRFPAMVDYPVHLARQFVLIGWNQSTALQVNYALDWGIKPNLAMDIAIPVMARWMPIELATKIFTIMAMLSPIIGATLLSKVLNTSARITALVSLCFAYHLALIGGFANFVMGIGLALAGFALWIRLFNESSFIRTIAGVSLVILCFFTHLFALGSLVLLIISYEIGCALSDRSNVKNKAIPLIFLLVTSMILWLLKPDGPEDGYILYGNFFTRLKVLFSPFTAQANVSDITLLLLALTGFYLLYKNQKRMPIEKRMRLPLLTLLTMSFLIPQELSGGSVVSIRMPIILMFVLIASLKTQSLKVRQINILTVIILVFIIMRSVQITFIWRGYDEKFQVFFAESRHIPVGSRVIALHDLSLIPNDPLMSHMVTLSVMSQCAFVPHMAKLPDQHPIIPSLKTLKIDGGTSIPLTPFELKIGTDSVESNKYLKKYPLTGWSRAYFIDWPQNFDYVVHVYDTGKRLPNPDPRYLSMVKESSFFTIYRVNGRPDVQPMICSYEY
jgi:hypothetical protein